jgi:hypothetical protein
MANTIITKNSATATAVPTAGQLVQGELAVNVTDKRLFTENSGGTVVEVGTNPSTIAVAGNATVGGTLGVTGLATLASSTLTTNPTLSAGTANGVTYLNGSKVLTSGSALTFNGSALTLAGDLTVNNAGNTDSMLRVAESVGTVYFGGNGNGKANIYFSSPSASAPTYSFFGDANTGMFWPAADTVGWSVGGSEKMRLTSTSLYTASGINVLLGNSTDPLGGNRLLVQSASTVNNNRTMSVYNTAATSTTAFANRILQLSSSGSGADVTIHFSDQVANNAYIGMGSGALYFAIGNGTTKNMTLTSSGNLGLGVTPSATSAAGYTSFELGANAGTGLTGNNGDLYLTENAYVNGGAWRYAASSIVSAMYNLGSGVHRWYTAPSGTAGNAISFTQAMTLTSAGDLLVGGTSAKGQITSIKSSSTTTFSSLGHGMLGLQNTSSTNNNYTWMNFYESNGNYVGAIGTLNEVHSSASNTVKGSLVFATKQSGVGGYPVERMRIDSAGNVGIGTSLPQAPLHVTGTIKVATGNAQGILALGEAAGSGVNVGLWRGAANAPTTDGNFLNLGGYEGIVFATGNAVIGSQTRQMVITDGGNLLVGTTSGSNHVIQKSNASSIALNINNSSATSPRGVSFTFSAASPNDGTATFFTTADSTAYRGGWLSNGGVQNYQGNDSNLSDRREKTNFSPAKSYLETICAIPVQTFNYIDQNMEEDGGLTLGVVAQDVKTVAPELVMESNWGTEEEPKMRLSIYQTDLQYALMKCIQEQQAIIESLTARVSALEGN